MNLEVEVIHAEIYIWFEVVALEIDVLVGYHWWIHFGLLQFDNGGSTGSTEHAHFLANDWCCKKRKKKTCEYKNPWESIWTSLNVKEPQKKHEESDKNVERNYDNVRQS